MYPSDPEAVKQTRRLLQNPYALIEQIEEQDVLRKSRFILQDPYAHLEQIEVANTVEKPARVRKDESRRRRPDFEIERLVRDLQLEIWRSRERIFGRKAVAPLEILDPMVALRHLGFEAHLVDGLGRHQDARGSYEVAGLLDRSQMMVCISAQLPKAVRNFTAAHELAHAVIHDALVMHRDPPLTGTDTARDPEEVEANRFASLFLMPATLLRKEFELRFGRAPLSRDDLHNVASMRLGSASPTNLRKLCKFLASAMNYNGRSFDSLARLFGVSEEALAIRIEELKLVQ